MSVLVLVFKRALDLQIMAGQVSMGEASDEEPDARDMQLEYLYWRLKKESLTMSPVSLYLMLC